MSVLDLSDPAAEAAQLRRRIAKLEKINAALMAHVERATDQHEGAYSLFQTAIMLEGRVRARTEELTNLMRSLERSNAALKLAKEEAETANRSKTRFLAAASHDLLQPLNATRLSTSALLGLDLGAEARTIAAQVERGLDTIEDVIKTLLDISKLDAGVVRPARKRVRIAPILAEIAEGFRPAAVEKGLRLIVRGADVAVETDPVLLKRIVQNLVSNAVRYTTTGGVLVAARGRRDGRCVVDVVDTGPGIPEAERELVFEEFYRGARSGPSDGGLGLGLSIVRRMAAALDHPVTVASRLDRGSRFALALPLVARPDDDDAPASGEGDVGFAGARVVIVENDAATRTALARLLQSWGLSVTALAAAGERHPGVRPDVVLADYHLDNGAIGLDVIATLRADATPGLPAIVMTADHSEKVEACVRAARCELVRKPVKPGQLRSLLSFLLAPSGDA